MKVEPIQLTGSFVTLLPVELEHAEGLTLAGNKEEIWAYMPYAVDSITQAKLFIQQALAAQEKGNELVFVVFDNQTNEIVGSTRFLDIDTTNKSVEIGWTWYHPKVWRTGVNTECKYLMLSHAFETWGCIRVQLKADARNKRSRMAIERIGAKYEGTLRQHRILQDGYYRDSAYYSIIDSEWENVSTNLKEKMKR